MSHAPQEANSTWRKLVNSVVGFATCLISLLILLILVSLIYGYLRQRDWMSLAIVLSISHVGLPLELVLFGRALLYTVRVSESPDPTMLRLALGLQAPRGIRRYLAVIWWALHLPFTMLLPISYAIENNRPQDFTFSMVMSLVMSAFCAVAFGYLLLASACLEHSERRIRSLARWWWFWGAFCGTSFLILDMLN